MVRFSCIFVAVVFLTWSADVDCAPPGFNFNMVLVGTNSLQMTMSTTQTDNWVSVGWNSQGNMIPADVIVCKLGNVPVCVDQYCRSRAQCPNDASQDIQFTSTLENNIATFVITRPLNTGDANDQVVVPGDQAMIWANAAGPISKEHTAFGSFVYSLKATGGTPTGGTPTGGPTTGGNASSGTNSVGGKDYLYWIAFGVFMFIILCGGIVSFFNLSFLRHSRIGPGISHGLLGMDGIFELSLGDILFITIFLGSVAIAAIGFWFASTSLSAGKSVGFATAIMMGLVLFPVTRFNVFSYILGISLERTIKYHRWLGRIMWTAMTIHFIIMANAYGADVVALKSRIFGLVSWICLTIMMISSFEPIRRRWYEVFIVTHLIFFIPTLLFACLHYSYTFVLVVISGAQYLLDIAQRIYFLLRKTEVEALALGESHTMVTIRPASKVNWGPGQWIFLLVGGDAHPFSIANAPAKDADKSNVMRLYIKSMGKDTFTGRLNANAANGIEARFMGPYGSLSVPLDKYSCIYLCAGGIGVTPIASILSFLVAYPERYPKIKSVTCVWTVREKVLIEQYAPLLLQAQQNAQWKVAVYLSANKEPFINDNQGSKVLDYGFEVQSGRPAVGQILGSRAPPENNEAAAMYLCGPDQFVATSINDARALPYPVHIHTETFYF